MVPENIISTPWNSPQAQGRGISKARVLKGKCKLNLNWISFLEGMGMDTILWKNKCGPFNVIECV